MTLIIDGNGEAHLYVLAQIRNHEPHAQALERIELALSPEENYESYQSHHPPGPV